MIIRSPNDQTRSSLFPVLKGASSLALSHPSHISPHHSAQTPATIRQRRNATRQAPHTQHIHVPRLAPTKPRPQTHPDEFPTDEIPRQTNDLARRLGPLPDLLGLCIIHQVDRLSVSSVVCSEHAGDATYSSRSNGRDGEGGRAADLYGHLHALRELGWSKGGGEQTHLVWNL
jgi:hypothetical protein